MGKVAQGELSGILAEELIYSADYFPTKADKRMRFSEAKKLATNLTAFTKQQLAAKTAPREDVRPRKAIELKAQAVKMLPGRQRAKTYLQAFKMVQDSLRTLRSGGLPSPRISASERRQLWDLWRTAKATAEGNADCPSWLFKKMYSARLLKQTKKGTLTMEEATQKFREAVKRLYHENTDRLELICEQTINKSKAQALTNLTEMFLAQSEEDR
jgi:hypothetical protein